MKLIEEPVNGFENAVIKPSNYLIEKDGDNFLFIGN